MHPAPLPEGRGPAPYEWAILTGRAASAVTIHQVVERFDAGPVLWQSSFALDPKETVASLEYRCREVAATGAVAVFRDFDQFWTLRREQGPGTYCRLPRRRDRTLDWTEPTEMLDRKLRAFSPGRRFARVGKREAAIGEAQCWQQAHEHAPGVVVARRRNRHLVATADGFAFVETVGEDIEERLRRAAWPALSRAKRLLRR